MKRILLLAVLLTAACAHQAPIALDQHAIDYVKLNLALGQHDADWVDAYYGPPEWREQAKSENKPLAAIHAQAAALRETIGEQRSRASGCSRCGGTTSSNSSARS